MSYLQTDPQYKLRLPLDLKQQIENSAKNSNRSMNSDIVARLNDSFLFDNRSVTESIKSLEMLILKSQSTRRTEVSQRLNQLLGDINAIKKGLPLKPSHLAQAIGEDYAESVENWFAGREEPTFKQLELIANYLGGNVEWLQHGDSHIFPVKRVKLLEPTQGSAWFLESDIPHVLTDIYFIRSQNSDGELAIVKKYGDWNCVTYSTGLYVSEVGTCGGKLALIPFIGALKILYEVYIQTGKVNVSSYLLDAEKFSVLLGGEMHPLNTLRYAREELWWEDIWNTRYIGKNYWEGWDSLCERIQREIA